jgi:hypothetical protein
MKVTLASIAAILVFASSLCVEAAPTEHTEHAGSDDPGALEREKEYARIRAGEGSTLEEGDLCGQHEDCPPYYACLPEIGRYENGQEVRICAYAAFLANTK